MPPSCILKSFGYTVGWISIQPFLCYKQPLCLYPNVGKRGESQRDRASQRYHSGKTATLGAAGNKRCWL
ncbi:hypothetical protein CV016_12460 [Yersinia kristensenii]|nr:hypothetical protein CU276_14155 [Yersinia kristensenii]PJG62471.1 hypothetical protein CV016_12460 [Yersinia kristensenii]